MQSSRTPSVSEFIVIFDKVSLKDNYFNRGNFEPGQGGIGSYATYKRLTEDTNIGMVEPPPFPFQII